MPINFELKAILILYQEFNLTLIFFSLSLSLCFPDLQVPPGDSVTIVTVGLLLTEEVTDEAIIVTVELVKEAEEEKEEVEGDTRHVVASSRDGISDDWIVASWPSSLD